MTRFLSIVASALGIAALATPALAQAPDFSFGATTLGWADPTLVTLANLIFWFLVGGFFVLSVMYVLSRPQIRDWLTAGEYNEAMALREQYVRTGGQVSDAPVKMAVGEAIYIGVVLMLDKIVALAVAWMVIWAAVS